MRGCEYQAKGSSHKKKAGKQDPIVGVLGDCVKKGANGSASEKQSKEGQGKQKTLYFSISGYEGERLQGRKKQHEGSSSSSDSAICSEATGDTSGSRGGR